MLMQKQGMAQKRKARHWLGFLIEDGDRSQFAAPVFQRLNSAEPVPPERPVKILCAFWLRGLAPTAQRRCRNLPAP